MRGEWNVHMRGERNVRMRGVPNEWMRVSENLAQRPKVTSHAAPVLHSTNRKAAP
jgi:hypothetical protein